MTTEKGDSGILTCADGTTVEIEAWIIENPTETQDAWKWSVRFEFVDLAGATAAYCTDHLTGTFCSRGSRRVLKGAFAMKGVDFTTLLCNGLGTTPILYVKVDLDNY